jgi:glycolate oxidase FAD binding subunit
VSEGSDLSIELTERVSEALSSGQHLCIRGAGSKPWNAVENDASILALSGHRGVVAYEPTELVVTVRAGTPLQELDEMLAASGQMLAAECPDFNGESTIGGALALGWSGARRPYAGSLRDFVLGVRMINGLGECLRFGGQVMKNVAGYDVPRLLSGSLGQLGAVLDISLKLLPLPESERAVALETDSLAQALSLVHKLRLRGEPLSAATFENGILRLRFSAGEHTTARLTAELGGESVDERYWRDLRECALPFFQPGNSGLWRLNLSPSADLSSLQGEALLDWGGELAWYRGPESATELDALLGPGAAVGLSDGPRALTGPVGDLQQRLVEAFDPRGVFTASSGNGGLN